MNGLFIVLAILAALSGLYVMQSVWKDDSVTRDAPWVRWSYRLAMIGISLSFLWCAEGVHDTGERPWLPILFVVMFWDIIMVTRAVSIGVRRAHWEHPSQRRWGRLF